MRANAAKTLIHCSRFPPEDCKDSDAWKQHHRHARIVLEFVISEENCVLRNILRRLIPAIRHVHYRHGLAGVDSDFSLVLCHSFFLLHKKGLHVFVINAVYFFIRLKDADKMIMV
jgi:hypothetical protein